MGLAGFGVPALAAVSDPPGGDVASSSVSGPVTTSSLSTSGPARTDSTMAETESMARRKRVGRHLLLTIRVRHAASVREGGTTRLRIGIAIPRSNQHSLSRRVWLSVTDLPHGALARFQDGHRFIHPGGSTTLTIRALRAAPLGRYTVRIRAVRHLQGASSARIARAVPSAHGSAQLSLEITPSGSGGSNGDGSGNGTGSGDSGSGGGDGNGAGSGNSGGGSVPTHVPTWAYDDGCNGGQGASAGLVQQWVTYAESNCGPGDTKVMADCQGACTPVEYLDTNWIYQQGSVPVSADAHEDWWLHEPGHTDASHRIYKDAYGGGNVLNQSDPAVQDWFRRYVQANFNDYPALMMDDVAPSLQAQLYHSGYTSSQELQTNGALQAAHEAMAAALTHTDGSPYLQIDNSLTINPYLPSPFPMLDHSGIRGVVAEGAPMSDGQLTGFYSTMLDDMAYIDHTNDDFMVMLSYDSSGSADARITQAATDWLGYSGDHIVSWADMETNNNNLSIWPEQGIVPTDPVQTMSAPGGNGCLAGTGIVCSSGGAQDLQVASGVYRREFGECYNQGTPFGPCAAIVNTNDSPVTIKSSWLNQNYSHRITLNGGDVQSGGSVDVSGASFNPGETTVPAQGSVLLAG